MLYIYMKDFHRLRPISIPDHNIDIKSFDVSLLVSSVIQNINIPLESTSEVYPILKDQGYLLIQYRMKEI